VTQESADHIDEIVAQWHRERPDLDTAPMATLGRLFRVAQLAQPLLSTPLRKLGLQPGWFDLLAALRRAGTPYQLNPTDLMRATMLSSGGMTKRLDRLADAGLVERSPDPHDRRGTLVRLTSKGKATIDRAVGLHIQNEAKLLDVLTTTQRQALDRSLRSLLAALESEHSSARALHGLRERRGGAARPARGSGRRAG
jgi:DNA-binding MarR family transcriptional regulator